MKNARVSPDHEIIVPISIVSDSESIDLDAIVDTGFNGFLTLPIELLKRINAVSAGTRSAELGNGFIAEVETFFVTVNWNGTEIDLLVLGTGSTPLIGMSLLWGSRVSFDAIDGGAVEITFLE